MAGGAAVPGHLGAVPSQSGKNLFSAGVGDLSMGGRDGWAVSTGRRASTGSRRDAVGRLQRSCCRPPAPGGLGQPATQLHDHLSGPVGDLLVAASLLLVVSRRRRQYRERQRPMARPTVAQPHQGDPAQPAGLASWYGWALLAVDGPSPDRPHDAFQGRCRRPTGCRHHPGAGATSPAGRGPPHGTTTPLDWVVAGVDHCGPSPRCVGPGSGSPTNSSCAFRLGW